MLMFSAAAEHQGQYSLYVRYYYQVCKACSACRGGFGVDALHANSSQCNMMEDHRTMQETGLCEEGERRGTPWGGVGDVGGGGGAGSMSDCCSCCWAGLTGCHSHRDAMPQPKHGGGCLPVQQLWDEGRCAPALFVSEVHRILGGWVGWIETLGMLLCTNQRYIFLYMYTPPSQSLFCLAKSKAGARQSHQWPASAGSAAICQILMSDAPAVREPRDKVIWYLLEAERRVQS